MTIQVNDSKKKETNTHDEEVRVRVFARQMLVARIFTASYTGRYYVDSLNDYRDVVQISDNEVESIREFLVVKQRVEDFYKKAVWVSITEPKDSPNKKWGHCIWTKLENVPFGCYWFTIKDVRFSDSGEMVIEVQVVRKYKPEEEKKEAKDGHVEYDEIKKNVFNFVQSTITWNNVKESVKFLFLFSMTIVSALLYGLQYLGDYSLRFFREFNNFIKVCTPIFLHFIDLISKVVGGFYLLIAMLWNGRGNQGPRPYFPELQAPQQPRPLNPPPYYKRNNIGRY